MSSWLKSPCVCQIEIDPDLYNVVANATGISTDRITIVAYRENVFFDREGLNVSATDWILPTVWNYFPNCPVSDM